MCVAFDNRIVVSMMLLWLMREVHAAAAARVVVVLRCEQHLHHFGVPFSRRAVECREPVHVLQVAVRPRGQLRLCDAGRAAGRAGDEWGSAVGGSLVRVRPVLEQELGQGRVVVVAQARQKQRAHSAARRVVHVRTKGVTLIASFGYGTCTSLSPPLVEAQCVSCELPLGNPTDIGAFPNNNRAQPPAELGL